MQADDGKTPLWVRGDSNRGLVLWPVVDGYVLSVHLESETTDLHLQESDIEALHDALCKGPVAVEPDVPTVDAHPGPLCDRCKQTTQRTADGYACVSCKSATAWV